MQRFKALATIFALFILSAPAVVSAAQIQARDVGVGTYVADRTLGGTRNVFDPSVGRLYAFSRVLGAEGETMVYHRWYYGDQLMAEVPLNVRSNDWRTWSSKQVMPEWTGEWRVVVVTEDGSVLDYITFTIG